MEPIVQEMRDKAFDLELKAYSYLQMKKGYRFVDTQTREEAKTLLLQIQQGYPSNQELQGLKMGTRFTWKQLKHLADTIFRHL
jgi:hypothetical protein